LDFVVSKFSGLPRQSPTTAGAWTVVLGISSVLCASASLWFLFEPIREIGVSVNPFAYLAIWRFAFRGLNSGTFPLRVFASLRENFRVIPSSAV
jgi:hypothetical protein